MDKLWPLVGILAALSVGVVSPGPSFIMVARTAVAISRADAVAAALGMGAGGVLFAALALLGLQGLLFTVPSLYLGLKLLGGLFLAYLGFQIFRSAQFPLSAPGANATRGHSLAGSFALGLTTQASNPKTAIVYASVMAAFLPAHVTVVFGLSLLALVFAVEAGWYSLVALALSSKRPREAYFRAKLWVDRLAGGALIALSLSLLASAHPA